MFSRKITWTMKLFTIIFTSLLIPITHSLQGISPKYVGIVSHLLSIYQKPALVWVLACHRRKDTINLILTLNKLGYPFNILSYEKVQSVNNIMINHMVLLIDMSCPNMDSLYQLADEKMLFMPSYRWILFYNASQTNPNKLVNAYFQDSNLQIHSDITLLGIEADASMHKVDKIYRFKRKYEVIIEDVGYWSTESSFRKDFIEKTIGRYRQDLGGKILRAILYLHDMESANHLIDKRDKNIDSKAKVDYALTQVLTSSLNATLDCELAFIYDYSVDNWTLPTYALYRGVDFAASGLAISALQLDIVDFLDVTSFLRYRLLIEEPKLSSVANLYALPFSSSVWYILTTLVLTMISLLYFIMKVETKWLFHSDVNDNEMTWTETAFIAYSEIMKQGAIRVLDSSSGKIVAVVLLVYVVLVHISYSAKITALLYVSKHHIVQIDDLLKYKIRIFMDASSYYIYSLENHEGTTLEKVIRENADPEPMEIGQGIHKLHEPWTGYQTCIDDILPVVGKTFSETEKCRLTAIDLLGSPQAWFTIPKNSTLKETVKIKMKKINESGMRKREFKLLYSEKPQCSQSNVFVDVSLKDCYPAFAILGTGIIFSILLMFLEHCIYHRYKWRQEFLE